MEKINYFSFLGWIEKAGVVPLFSLAFFLFLPMPFFLFSLLFFVTLVLETIFPPNIENKFLPLPQQCVKVHFILFLLSALSIYSSPKKNKDIVLSIGQVHEIKIKKLNHFTVTNKDILKYRLNKKTLTLLIKGKKLGYSQIVIWSEKDKKQTYDIYILSKTQHLKLAKKAKNLSEIGLNANIQGGLIFISGKVLTRKNLEIFHFITNKQDIFISNIEIDKELQKSLISDIYYDFFQLYKDTIKCSGMKNRIVCEYEYSQKPLKSLEQKWKSKIPIEFNHYKESINKNFRVFLKIIKVEGVSNKSLDLGLEQIETNIAQLNSYHFRNFMKSQNILISNNLVLGKTISSTEGITQIGETLNIKIGQDIPYETSTENSRNIKWRFSGLNITIILKKANNKIQINQKTILNSPGNGKSINSNINSSSIFVTPSKIQKLFSSKMETFQTTTTGIPYLEKIPLAGNLFKKTLKGSTIQKILTYIYIEEENIK